MESKAISASNLKLKFTEAELGNTEYTHTNIHFLTCRSSANFISTGQSHKKIHNNSNSNNNKDKINNKNNNKNINFNQCQIKFHSPHQKGKNHNNKINNNNNKLGLS